jgi:hypothetical protein
MSWTRPHHWTIQNAQAWDKQRIVYNQWDIAYKTRNEWKVRLSSWSLNVKGNIHNFRKVSLKQQQKGLSHRRHFLIFEKSEFWHAENHWCPMHKDMLYLNQILFFWTHQQNQTKTSITNKMIYWSHATCDFIKPCKQQQGINKSSHEIVTRLFMRTYTSPMTDCSNEKSSFKTDWVFFSTALQRNSY